MQDYLSEFIAGQELRVLLLEDSPDDALFIQNQLKKLGLPFQLKRVETREAFAEGLEIFSPDVILSDYNLPTFDGLEALELKKRVCPGTAFVFVTGFLGEERAVETIKKGASDFVLKDNLERLPQVVLSALREGQGRKERIKSELALLRSEAKYRQLMEQAADGIVVCDAAMNFLEANSRVCEMLGYSKEELLAISVHEILPEGISFPTEVVALLAPGKTIQFESMRKRKDGTVFPAEISIAKTTDGYYQAVLRDVSRRQAVMKALERALNKLEFHVSNSPLAVVEIAKTGEITRWSGQAEKMFGWREEEVLGRTTQQLNLVHPDELEESRHAFQRSFHAANKQYVFLGRACTKEGTVVYCEWYNSIFLDEAGEFHSLLSLANNITVRKLSEEAKWEGQMQERNRIAREIHEGIGQMLVASKFKLASLTSSTENLEEKIAEAEDLLIKTLDEVRRISLNMAPRSVEEFGIENAIRQLCQQVGKMTGIEVVFHYVGQSNFASNSVLSTFFRLVQEGLNNVIKHARAAKVWVELEQKEKEIVLKLEDNGIGFEIEKVDSSRSSGLGNMKERVRLLGGQFTISSRLQEGTLLKVRIPIAAKS